MIKSLFLNLAISNKQQSKTFFENLGMSFNKMFEDETSCCLVVNEHISVMLLETTKFQSFTNKTICNSHESVEALIALQVQSKEEVDEIMQKAVAAGGKDIGKVQEYDFMYSRDFDDLDGHTWEVFWMKAE